MSYWQVANRQIGNGKIPDLMGILNCTPDSFFDGGKHNNLDSQYAHACKMLADGATIIDVGGESTRPGAMSVDANVEVKRVLPIIKRLKELQRTQDFAISIDTTKAYVAQAAMENGAQIINDVTMGLSDPHMHSVMVKTKASLVLNHIQGEPRNMQQAPFYENCVQNVCDELLLVAQKLMDLGVAKEKICLDPGIGFGKRLEDNYALIQKAHVFVETGFAVLYGLSRKSFIKGTSGLENSDRLVPSVVAACVLAKQGVHVLRVHDILQTKEALIMNSVL